MSAPRGPAPRFPDVGRHAGRAFLRRVLAAVLLLVIGRSSVAVALGCGDDAAPVAASAGISTLAPAPPATDASASDTEPGVCLCACGCTHGQAATFEAPQTAAPAEPRVVPKRALTEHAPPTPVLPLRLRPPLA